MSKSEDTFYCLRGRHYRPVSEKVTYRAGRACVAVTCCQTCYENMRRAKSRAEREQFGRMQSELNRAEQARTTTNRMERDNECKADASRTSGLH